MAFDYKIQEGTNYILEESGNKFVAMRKISWNGRDPKIDIRKWYNDANGDEVMAKGVSLSEEGCDELSIALLQEGYGNTKEIINSIKGRKSFDVDLKSALNGTDDSDSDSDISDDDYYDPEEMLG